MIGRPTHQGFFEAELDYRHEQLMSQVAQSFVPRRSVSCWMQDMLAKPRHRHATSQVCRAA
jgi:hypothetical protein